MRSSGQIKSAGVNDSCGTWPSREGFQHSPGFRVDGQPTGYKEDEDRQGGGSMREGEIASSMVQGGRGAGCTWYESILGPSLDLGVNRGNRPYMGGLNPETLHNLWACCGGLGLVSVTRIIMNRKGLRGRSLPQDK